MKKFLSVKCFIFRLLGVTLGKTQVLFNSKRTDLVVKTVKPLSTFLLLLLSLNLAIRLANTMPVPGSCLTFRLKITLIGFANQLRLV